MKQAYLLAIKWNLVISAVDSSCFSSSSCHYFPVRYREELYYEFAVLFMRTFLFMVLVNGVQLLSSNFFTAIGKALKGLFLSLTRQIFFLIPLMLLLPLWLGLFGVLVAGPIADGIAFVVSVIFVVREFRKMSQLEEQQKARLEVGGGQS